MRSISSNQSGLDFHQFLSPISPGFHQKFLFSSFGKVSLFLHSPSVVATCNIFALFDIHFHSTNLSHFCFPHNSAFIFPTFYIDNITFHTSVPLFSKCWQTVFFSLKNFATIKYISPNTLPCFLILHKKRVNMPVNNKTGQILRHSWLFLNSKCFLKLLCKIGRFVKEIWHCHRTTF